VSSQLVIIKLIPSGFLKNLQVREARLEARVIYDETLA
jgi:hypothetical protein